MFGSSAKSKATKPSQVRAQAMARRRPTADPQDTSIEGTLKQVLEQQEIFGGQAEVDTEKVDATEVDAPLVRLVNSLLSEAIRVNCSDIHIEPFENLLRIRFRVDGVLREIQKVPHKLTSAIVSRLKIMAELDICEKRIPQDGSFKYKSKDIEAEFRISTLPAAFGEKVVMRLMGGANVNNDLSKLGIPEDQLKEIRCAVTKPDGLVLVTGPTGSGKTTTLYAALNELNDISVSVFTAEDPIEGTLPGVTQCQVNTAVGYTFASILRSFLRQDPDIILVGEIRDQETAEISIKAALTGHLVLSTLHTNCAVSTISRLANMGIAPYLITSSVNCIVAQRLVRRVCNDCKQEIEVPAEVLERLGTAGKQLRGKHIWHGKGCNTCFNSGYKGRAPIYEVLTITDEIRRLILAGASREELRKVARAQGMITLREAGLKLVEQGITSLEEAIGATNEDSDLSAETPQPQAEHRPPPAQIIPDQASANGPANESAQKSRLEKERELVSRWRTSKFGRPAATA